MGLLIFFTAFFLWFGCANLFDHKLQHDFPYGYLASDAFLHQSIAESIKYMGNYKYELQAMSLTFDHKVAGYNPVILEHLSPIFSYLTGLEVYDTIYLLVFVSIIFSILVFYLILKKFNIHVAILSLSFILLVITKKFYSGITWGQFDFYIGTLFLIAFVWCIIKLDLKKMYILLGIFLAATFLAHTVETIWAIGFLVFYMLIKIIIKKFSFKEVKKIILGCLFSLVIVLYYVPIFLYLWFAERKGRLFIITLLARDDYLSILFSDLGVILMILIIAGLALSIFLMIKKKFNIALIFSIFMFLISFTIYIGFDKAQQLRFLWPIYLSFFFGLAIYSIGKFVLKKWTIVYSVVLSVVLMILFINIYYEEINTPGIINQYNWDALMWLKGNTPEKSKVFYFYSDVYSQPATVYNSLRMAYNPGFDKYLDNLRNGKIDRYYVVGLLTPIPYKPNLIPVRESFFRFKDYPREGDFSEGLLKVDTCEFDYYVLDKVTRQPIVAQYNMFIANLLLQNNWMEIVFNNEVSIIIKNNKPGVDCIVEQRIS